MPGVTVANGAPAREINERSADSAALAWAHSRSTLAQKDDPATWLTSLPATLHLVLLSLYALPPWCGAAAPPPDVVRPASVIELYAPVAPQGAGAPSLVASISSVRLRLATVTGAPPARHPRTSTAPLGPGCGAGPSYLGQAAPPRQTGRAAAAQCLPWHHALNSTSSMPPEKRAKFQESCSKSSLATVP
jgi:hypothetical protein